jgi:protein dithiol:quinone oxidoreductase
MGFGSLVFAFANPSGRACSKRSIVGASFLSLFCLTGIGLVIYQHFIAAAQSSCTFSKAEKLVIWSQLDQLLPSVFQVTASCADAALAKLLGVPYELASGMLFLALLTYSLINLRQFIFKVH